MGFVSFAILDSITMGIGGIERETKCFEGCGEFVIWESGGKTITRKFSGAVGDRFGDIDELSGKGVKFAALSVSIG